MIIGVISDTHIPQNADKIPQEIFKIFKGVNLILHAGDLTSLDVLDSLGRISQVKAVYGNMDSLEARDKLNAVEIIKIAGISIGLTHGQGHPDYLVDFVGKQFKQDLDVIIFGHSHRAYNQKKNNTLFFNPGSPTDKTFAPYNSCGILKIGEGIEAEIIKLGD